MNLVYRTEIVIAAVEAYLEANPVATNAPYSRSAVIYDQLEGWLEQMNRIATKPSYVTLDEDDAEILNNYLQEV
jgi:hypothetical protein